MWYIFVTCIVLILMLVATVPGSYNEIVLKLLLKKGVITQEEYEELMLDVKDDKTMEEKIAEIEKKTENLAKEHKALKKSQGKVSNNMEKEFTAVKDKLENTVDNLQINGGITLIGQGTWGNDNNFPEYEEVIDGTYSVDLEVSAPVGEGEAFLLMEAGDGAGLSDEIPAFHATNDDVIDNENKVEVTEAWYEHKWLDDKLIYTVGKLDLTNYFDINEVANDETLQFIASPFVNSIAIEFPDNVWGMRAQYIFNDLVDLGVGYQSGDGDWEDIIEDPFLIAELALRPQLGEAELQGNYRFFWWTNRTEHTNWKRLSRSLLSGRVGEDDLPDFPPEAPAEDKLINYGLGFSFDQQVTDDLTLFTRYGYQDQDANAFESAASLGFNLNGRLWGRENDVFGLAYGIAILANDYEDVLKIYGRQIGISERHPNKVDYILDDENEEFYEAYYSISVNDSLFISPDIQHITNTFGLDENDSAWIFGLRMQLLF
jgi:carbohydrate-selective porin OprB